MVDANQDGIGPSECNHTKNDGSWWEYDIAGIALCRVCDKCRKQRLSHYRPEVLSEDQRYGQDAGDATTRYNYSATGEEDYLN